MTAQPPSTIELVAQYVRDFSFEHPNAPNSIAFARDAMPTADVQVSYRQLDANTFESFITITASAKTADTVIALVECSYAGTYRVPPIYSELRESFLMVDAPRDLFPFARALIGLVTQAAGIPPLLIATPNFAESYRVSREQTLTREAKA